MAHMIWMGIFHFNEYAYHFSPTFVVSHNNALPNQHFRKEWDVRVRTWLDQPMAKLRRRAARKAKAAKIAPRPAAGPLRPVVRCPTIKYNTKVRAGRGFTVEEIKGAGLSPAKAKTLGIAVDFRRSNKSVESLTANVERIKAYLEKLVIFPSKSGAKYVSSYILMLSRSVSNPIIFFAGLLPRLVSLLPPSVLLSLNSRALSFLSLKLLLLSTLSRFLRLLVTVRLALMPLFVKSKPMLALLVRERRRLVRPLRRRRMSKFVNPFYLISPISAY